MKKAMKIKVINRSAYALPPYETATIDPDYRGEIKAILVNLSDESFEIKPGERIAQLVVARFERAEWESVETLGETARGEGGMGSTGRG